MAQAQKIHAQVQKKDLKKLIPRVITSSPKVVGDVVNGLEHLLFGSRERIKFSLNLSNAKKLAAWVKANFPGVKTNFSEISKEGKFYALRLWKESALGAVPFREAPKPKRQGPRTEPGLLEKPVHLTLRGWNVKYQKEEASAFDAVQKRASREFSEWFNSLSEQDKRAFVLFVRSNALSAEQAKRERKGGAVSGRASAQQLRTIMDSYLKENALESEMKDYIARSKSAQEFVGIFLSKNPQLGKFLGANFGDFKEGLFYFFMEHQLTAQQVVEKSSEFLGLMKSIESISKGIIKRRSDTRYGTARGVSDSQVREIVASSFFGQVFYHLDARFMLSIVTLESNFDMSRGDHGVGVTQQITNAANNDLKSPLMRKQMDRLAGIRVERQMVTMSLLGENIFLNMMEGVKTATLKCGAAGIRTSDIGSSSQKQLARAALVASYYNGNLSPHPAHPERTVQEVYREQFALLYKNHRKLFAA